jgi:hypothetical protein
MSLRSSSPAITSNSTTPLGETSSPDRRDGCSCARLRRPLAATGRRSVSRGRSGDFTRGGGSYACPRSGCPWGPPASARCEPPRGDPVSNRRGPVTSPRVKAALVRQRRAVPEPRPLSQVRDITAMPAARRLSSVELAADISSGSWHTSGHPDRSTMDISVRYTPDFSRTVRFYFYLHRKPLRNSVIC